jgi:hypothetical protein
MLKALILSIMLSTAAMAQQASTPELRGIDFRLLNIEYEHNIEKCFLYYEICELKKADQCWDRHERSVIGTTKK